MELLFQQKQVLQNLRCSERNTARKKSFAKTRCLVHFSSCLPRFQTPSGFGDLKEWVCSEEQRTLLLQILLIFMFQKITPIWREDS